MIYYIMEEIKIWDHLTCLSYKHKCNSTPMLEIWMDYEVFDILDCFIQVEWINKFWEKQKWYYFRNKFISQDINIWEDSPYYKLYNIWHKEDWSKPIWWEYKKRYMTAWWGFKSVSMSLAKACFI